MKKGNSDLTGYLDAPMAEIVRVLEAAGRESTDRVYLERVGSLVVDRTLDLLRGAARSQIIDERVDLDRFLSSDVVGEIKHNHPDVFGGWAALSDLLAEAARRSDPPAADTILKGSQGLGYRLLEFLAERGAPMARAEIRERLNLSESHLSHLLRDLSEADLVVRDRRGREAMIDLGPVGREVVRRALAPAWIDIVVQRVERLREGDAEHVDAEVLDLELRAAGAPSRLVSHRLAVILASMPTERANAGESVWEEEMSSRVGTLSRPVRRAA